MVLKSNGIILSILLQRNYKCLLVRESLSPIQLTVDLLRLCAFQCPCLKKAQSRHGQMRGALTATFHSLSYPSSSLFCSSARSCICGPVCAEDACDSVCTPMSTCSVYVAMSSPAWFRAWATNERGFWRIVAPCRVSYWAAVMFSGDASCSLSADEVTCDPMMAAICC